MAIRTYQGITPDIAPTAYIDDSAVVIGDVSIGEESSVWPMVVVRGDVNSISIGHHTNIQDASVLHVTHDHELTPGGFALKIGNWVTVGHRVTLHGCTIGDSCLIGMSATIMDAAVIHDNVVVGAGSLVTPGKQLESGYLYVGSPIKKARKLTDQELASLNYSAEHYSRSKYKHLESNSAQTQQ